MSDTAGWFARALGRAPQQPQQPQPQAYQQPVQPPQPFYPPQVPQQYVQQPQAPVQPGPSGPPVAGYDAAGRPIVNVMDGVASWQGTRAAKEDNATCPGCGGSNYFKREKIKMKNGASPSPICMDCGYNGIFELQFGAATPVDPNAPVWGE